MNYLPRDTPYSRFVSRDAELNSAMYSSIIADHTAEHTTAFRLKISQKWGFFEAVAEANRIQESDLVRSTEEIDKDVTIVSSSHPVVVSSS